VSEAEELEEEEGLQKIKTIREGAPGWVVTFGDLMSLLLTFFVLLLSFATMDPERFKVVRGSLDQALGIQKQDPIYETPRSENIIAKTFNRRDFNQSIESIVKKKVRDSFPPGHDFGAVERFTDVRGVLVRFVAPNLFQTGGERLGKQARAVLRVMAETMVEADARIEVQVLSTEKFSLDARERGRKRSDGVSKLEAAARRAVIGAEGVLQQRIKGVKASEVIPSASPRGLRVLNGKNYPDKVTNITEFVFFARGIRPGAGKAK